MSAIMRRRRSLIGLSLIEGSCPELEFGTLNLQGGTLAPSSSLDQLVKTDTAHLLRSARSALPRERARAGSFSGPLLPTADAAACPQLAEGDIRALEACPRLRRRLWT